MPGRAGACGIPLDRDKTVVIERGRSSVMCGWLMRPVARVARSRVRAAATVIGHWVLGIPRMRKTLTSYRVQVTGERDKNLPRVYTEACLDHLIGGPGLDAAAVGRAIQLAETTYCSGTPMFAKTAMVANTFRLLPA
jgi:hypothetical protein